MLLLDDGTPAGIEALPRIPLIREADEATCSLVRIFLTTPLKNRVSLLCGTEGDSAPQTAGVYQQGEKAGGRGRMLRKNRRKVLRWRTVRCKACTLVAAVTTRRCRYICCCC